VSIFYTQRHGATERNVPALSTLDPSDYVIARTNGTWQSIHANDFGFAVFFVRPIQSVRRLPRHYVPRNDTVWEASDGEIGRYRIPVEDSDPTKKE